MFLRKETLKLSTSKIDMAKHSINKRINTDCIDIEYALGNSTQLLLENG